MNREGIREDYVPNTEAFLVEKEVSIRSRSPAIAEGFVFFANIFANELFIT